MRVKDVFMYLVIAISVAVLMTLLSAVPPLRWIYAWTERNDLPFIWYGLISSVIASSLMLYQKKRKKWRNHSDMLILLNPPG